jgi:hypothetical protein
MPNYKSPLIVELNNRRYLVCKHSGQFLERAYAIPELNRDGSFRLNETTGYPIRWGSFADGAAAAGFIESLFESGSIKEKTKQAYQRAIHRDLGLPEITGITVAPSINPTNTGARLDYQYQCPEMIPAAEQFYTIEQLEPKKKSRASPSSKPNFYLHEINESELGITEPISRYSLKLDNFDRLEVCTSQLMLHRRPLSQQPEQSNLLISQLTGLSQQGNWLLINRQPTVSLPKSSEQSTPSSTCSSQSGSSSSQKRLSMRRSKKSSERSAVATRRTRSKTAASSSEDSSAVNTRQSKKRKLNSN